MNRNRVIWENRGFCRVATSTGEIVIKVHPGCNELPVTGDWVLVDNGEITEICTRQNKLSRKKAGRESVEQILAANVDVAFLVTGLDGDFNIRRLERYLILAKHSGVTPVVVLNKRDLCDDPFAAVEQVDAVTQGMVPVALISALDPASVHHLHRYVDYGQTAVLLGSSGAGKSTIVNALLGAETQATLTVRDSDHRGRHSTTSRHLFQLTAGWSLIDTPGLRELEPWASPESAMAVFDDIAEAALNCKFRNCTHSSEPACAVIAAIEKGTLDSARLDSFRKIVRELQHLEVKQNSQAARDQKQRWKVIHKAMRNQGRQC